MSFSLTTEAILNRTKTVTRRLGWSNLKPGEEFSACKKCMGLKAGEKIERLAVLRCVTNTPEPLHLMFDSKYGAEEAIREGFPQMTGTEFVDMFCSHMRVTHDATVHRIEFEYVG
jgi:hypothetical protein